jgi:hypothetical protein
MSKAFFVAVGAQNATTKSSLVRARIGWHSPALKGRKFIARWFIEDYCDGGNERLVG